MHPPHFPFAPLKIRLLSAAASSCGAISRGLAAFRFSQQETARRRFRARAPLA
jgi:hypothetical protein